MTPTYHSRASPFLIDLNEDLPQRFSSPKPTEAASSSSSLSYPIILVNPSQEGGGYYHGESQQQEEAKLHGESCHHPETKTEIDSAGLKFSLHMIKKEDRNGNDKGNNGSVKWMPSKVRLVRKMMSSDRKVSDPPSQKSQQKFGDQKDKHLSSPSMTDDYSSSSSSNNNNAVRVCSDCNTTKTPLWRSGPRGPKSLCNACGIRQRKARRAAAAAAALAASANGGTIFANDAPPTVKTNKLKVQNKDKNTNNSHLPFKKRCKFTAQARGRSKKLCFEDLAISLSKNSAFQRVFPQDEREAAILLMALSYGLVHG